jgi:hypothetical protein
MKIILTYFGVALLFECASAYFALHQMKDWYLSHAFTIIEYGLLTAAYSCWQDSHILKKILVFSIPFFTLLGIISFYFMEDSSHLNTLTRPLSNFLLVVAAAYTLLNLDLETMKTVFAKPQFWVSSASLLYFGTTLILFASANSLLRMPDTVAQKYFLLDPLMYIFSNMLYAGGFLCLDRARNYSGPS